jgi:hypothetical protein
MNKDYYYFKNVDYLGNVTSIKFTAERLPDVLEKVQQFLVACTFNIDGELQIVEDNELDNGN